MRFFSLTFLLGIVLFQQMTHLPEKKWIWLFPIIILFNYFTPIRRYLHWAIAVVFGLIWCLWYAHGQLQWTLPNNLEGKNVIVEGKIASIPNDSFHWSEFLFLPKKLIFENQTYYPHGLLKLSWQGFHFPLKAGDEWRLHVRLKKIHSTLNPGGFDYEAHALEEGICARGYIVKDDGNQWLSSHWYYHSIDRIRQFLQKKIVSHLPPSTTSSWIPALVMGERQGISEENWEILRNTGTNHLMAIAGLHIGCMTALASGSVSYFWRRIPALILRLPVSHAGAFAALAMALIYSALAGFSLPTQRASIMLLFFLFMLLIRRKILPWHAWSLALMTILFINPLSVLTESFWLSFGAVAFIIFGTTARLAPKGIWWHWGRIQWVIALGLIPFGIWLFQQCSLTSFLANSIAIPWVGLIVVPLSLIGTLLLLFSDRCGTCVLIVADKMLTGLWKILTWLAHYPGTSLFLVPPHWVIISACLGVVILLLPKGFPGKLWGIICLLPLFLVRPNVPALGQVWFTLLDVGQGLAAVVQTQNHLLVYDTGAKLNLNYDMGQSVVVPFLRTLGTKKIDMLVISHGDNDHIGGSGAVIKNFPVQSIRTSVPEEFEKASYCLRGESWTWDQVTFQFLYPSSDNLGLDNNSSCVLRIKVGNDSILLTGDIEKFAEKKLIQTEENNLPATILIAPHHGSKTSAVDEFLEMVHPKYVLFPVGYRNRYHFPNLQVVQKYSAMGVRQLDTAQSGAIQFLLPNSSFHPFEYRLTHHMYWNQ